MEDPSWIDAAGRPASLRQTPQHCFSTGRHRGAAVGYATLCAGASGASVTGPGLVASSFLISSWLRQLPSRPARRHPW
jgi:hypothetical protein